jgi:hypothetical protein
MGKLLTDTYGDSKILVTMMMEALSSSETSFLPKPHSVTSQKTAFFIPTTAETSNLPVDVADVRRQMLVPCAKLEMFDLKKHTDSSLVFLLLTYEQYEA